MGQAESIHAFKETPLIGSAWAFTRDRLGLLSQVAESSGDIGCFHVGPVRVLLLNSPDLVRSVLVEQEDAFDKGWVFRHIPRSILGNGLLFSEGEFHFRQRRRVAPSFQPRNIAPFADIIVATAEQEQQRWEDNRIIDLGWEMGRLAHNILNVVLFGAHLFDENDALGKIINVPMRSARDVSLGLLMLSLGLPMPGSARVRRAIMQTRRRIEAMIRARRASKEHCDDLLAALMAARGKDGKQMSDEEVRDEAFTLFVAAHRNTTDALSWCLCLLAAHPDKQDNLRREAHTALGGRPATHADLPKFPYALQVCKEALRLYPPAYIIGRTALGPVQVGGHAMRKGDVALVSPYTMHRRRDFYPQPDSFDPGRFTPPNEALLPRHAYIPFGAGPRVCIGNHFTLMAVHLLLATLAQRVSFAFAPGYRLEPEIVFTLRPKRGSKMIVRRD